jgi:hypothetical protein
MDVINDKNSKIAIFLEDISFEKIENNKLFVFVKGVNEFSIKALENDRLLIESIINEVLDFNLSLFLNYEDVSKKDMVDQKDNKVKTDEDHPLFMDALNKFDGKLIN